jgi:hypothetical protein
MGYVINCLDCGTPVGGENRLIIGRASGSGKGGTLCIPCVVGYQKTAGIDGRLDKLIPWYRENQLNKPPIVKENESLKRTLEEQQAHLDFIEKILREHGIEVGK